MANVRLASGADPTADVAGEHEELWLLVAGLQSLPASQRTAIVCKFFEGLSNSRTASAMTTTEVSVKGYVARGRAGLRAAGVAGRAAR